ncbi:hypothetical protein IMG5_194070 [Ichthyophthirius multifiliis]|uniref:Uncharacterized protein n=1 Tax=Ichthyophthirius multifiliis TaxID=5932 RepID=G0R4N8_ICHMU|nr:hypothetical protein IMG5_194070 [Ichthyophthirius multifiliis]EGR27544.1 hypothetical protein IMG5_194070 [Ichthyophthirius multifiliis]|eukprot:XP_004024996.1 hypothetical protein IMG5_194070 [Ichthyophthirius multifiliis]
MQSFKLHIVSEHLKDRYPYLEAEFNDRYDKTEVYHAAFDRSIPKLIEILLMPDIEAFKYRDALITLNEMVSHQENKDIMISSGLVAIASAFLHHKLVEIRREAVLLIGSLVTIMRGRQHVLDTTYEGFQKMLFDQNLQAREACAWALCRFITGRDGVDQLCKAKIIEHMVNSFLQYTENPNIKEAKFIVCILEAFLNILQYDNGIIFFIRTGIVARLNQILKNENNIYYDKQWSLRINYLCLDCLAKIVVNMEGKQEGIDLYIINTASNFLDSHIQEERKYSSILIMNCSIHLDGKKQCTYVKNDEIIKKLISLLDSKDENLRIDVKQALKNISELPDGFLVITSILAHNLNYLKEVFSVQNGDKRVFEFSVITALSQLLPKTSELENPPNLPQDKITEYEKYCIAICSFILNYDEVINDAIEEIVKLVEKLAIGFSLTFLFYN